ARNKSRARKRARFFEYVCSWPIAALRSLSFNLRDLGASACAGVRDLRALRLGQRLCHVPDDVIRRFAAHAEPDESFAAHVAAPPRAPLGGGMHAAEARRFADDRQRLEKSLGALASAEIETHDTPEGRHLCIGRRVRRMVWQARVVYRRNSGCRL